MKKTILNLSLLFCGAFSYSQNGLDSVFVETYYISDVNDTTDAVNGPYGIIPVGSVTYRIFVDMKPGYEFQALYGINLPNHDLLLTTTTAFFNNEDRGATSPTYTKTQAAGNTVMLDSWFSVGAACTGQTGVPKSSDDGVATVVNADGMLQNNDPSAGIALIVQDGMIAGTPQTVTFVGLTTELNVFDATSQLGDTFLTNNGSVASLNGSVGPDAMNRVLVGQFTTNGQFCYELNIQLGTPTGGTESWVAKNPQGAEVTDPSLMGCVQASPVSAHEQTIVGPLPVVYPNPASQMISFEITPSKQNSRYTLYNVHGEKIVRKELGLVSQKHTEKIDLCSFADGIYILEVTVDGNTSFQKIIKNR